MQVIPRKVVSNHGLYQPFAVIALVAPLLSILADDVSEIGYALLSLFVLRLY